MVASTSRLQLLAAAGTKLISLAHVSNVTGAMLQTSAPWLSGPPIGGHQGHARWRTARAARACWRTCRGWGLYFYVFAGHKAYGADDGSSVGKARAARRHAAVHGRRLDDRPRDLRRDDLGAGAAPLRGGHAADRPRDRARHRVQLDARPRLDRSARSRDGPGAASDGRAAEDRRRRRSWGPPSLQNRYPVVSFMLDGVHPHDVAQTLNSFGVAVRAGHHCAQPLMDRFDLDGTTRVSIAPTTTTPTSTRC